MKTDLRADIFDGHNLSDHNVLYLTQEQQYFTGLRK